MFFSEQAYVQMLGYPMNRMRQKKKKRGWKGRKKEGK
jgi:hypothetical protein